MRKPSKSDPSIYKWQMIDRKMRDIRQVYTPDEDESVKKTEEYLNEPWRVEARRLKALEEEDG